MNPSEEKPTEADAELKKAAGSAKRKKERLSLRDSRMNNTASRSGSSRALRHSRKTRVSKRGIDESRTSPVRARVSMGSSDAAAEIELCAKADEQESSSRRDDGNVPLPGAYRSGRPGAENNDEDDNDDDSYTLGSRSSEPVSTVKNAVLHRPGSTIATPALQRARIVPEAERSNLVDETEKENIQRAARKETEERIKSKIAQAEAVDPSEIEEKKKRRRRIICWVFALFVLAVIGSVVGAVLASRKNRDEALSELPVTSAPTHAPTPLVEFLPILDECDGAQDLTEAIGLPILGSTRGSRVDRFDTCEIIERNGRGVWYKIVGDGRTKVASTCNNTFFDTQLSVYTGNCSQPLCVAGNDQIRCGNGDQSMLAWIASSGLDYFIHVHGHRNSQGVYELLIDDLKDNDECVDATQIVFNSDMPLFGSTRGKSLDDDLAANCGFARQVSAGVWYTVAGVDGNMVALAETGGLTSFRPQLSVYEGTVCAALSCVTGGVSESQSWTGESGKKYYILVHGRGSAEGDFRFRVSSDIEISPPPPPQDDDALLPCDEAGEVRAGDMGRGNTLFGPVSDAGACGPDVVDNAQGKWFTTTGTGGPMLASTCETTTNFDTQISVYRGDDCETLECVDGNDQSSKCGDHSTVAWHSDAGAVYKILVHGTTGRTGEFNLTVDDEITLGEPILVTSPTCEGAIALPIDLESVLGSFADAVVSDVGACAADVVGGQSGVWYKTLGTGRSLTVSACDSMGSAHMRLVVFTGSCDALTCVEAVSTPCGPQESVTWTSTPDEQYFIFAQMQSTGATNQDDEFVLYAGETVIHNLCRTPIGPIRADNNPIFGALWSATLGKKPMCNVTSDGPTGPGVWYSLIGNGERIVAHACSKFTSFDAQIQVFEGDCLDGPDLRCVEQVRETCENGQQITTWQSEPDVLYYILLSGFSSVPSSNFALTVSINNDICFGALGPLQADGSISLGSTTMATVDEAGSLPMCSLAVADGTVIAQPFDSSPGVWYEVIGTGKTMTASTCTASTFDSAVTVYGGASCERLSCVKGAVHEACGEDGGAMRVVWPSTEGKIYYVLVFGTGVGSFGLSVLSLP